MNQQTLRTSLLALAIASALVALPAIAQDSSANQSNATSDKNQASSSGNAKTLQQVIVTGAPTYLGVKKIDASFEVTALSLHDIKNIMPSSSADLLKVVPGIWPESSGGETGPNIDIAGFPGGGDAPYVTFELNGSPIYPSPTESFMDNSSMFRLDDMIQGVEVLQGGPSVIFGSGQIGAVVNFRLRQGTPQTKGEIGYTVGTHGYDRFDGYLSGQLSPGWFYSIGGFYRTNNGIRSPQFPADQGGQLTATLTHDLSNGSVMFYARDLSDKNLFITDVPLIVSANGSNISSFPGFSALTGTFASNALRMANIQVTPGNPPGTINADLANGRGAHVRMAGSNLDLYFDNGWTFSNSFNLTDGTMPTNALFNNLPPQTMSSFTANEIASANSDPAVVAAAGGPATSGTATFVDGGGAVSPNQPVASVGFWVVTKRIHSFNDEARVTKEIFKNNNLTAGMYFASYTSNDVWYLGNNMLVTAANNAQPINLTLNNGAQVTRNGFISGPFYSLIDSFSGKNTAGYLYDQWKMGRWLFDGGVRVENDQINGSVSNDSTVNLDNNPLTLYNNNTAVPNGSFTPEHFNGTRTSWTLGANYRIAQNMSAYARVNQGYHFPSFDDLRNGQPVVQKVKNLQVGLRMQEGDLYASVTVYRRIFSGVPYQAYLANGTSFTAIYGASSHGVNFDMRWTPIQHLALDLIGDWDDSRYAHYASTTFNYNGNMLIRQPRWQLRFAPSYEIPTSWGSIGLFGAYSHISYAYSDIANQQLLPPYYTLDGGVIANVGKKLQFRLEGTNLTNQIGLTEGNARLLNSGIVNGLEMARPIFGREIRFQVNYKL